MADDKKNAANDAELKKQLEALQAERDQLQAARDDLAKELQMAQSEGEKRKALEAELEKTQAALAAAREQMATIPDDQLFLKVPKLRSYLCEQTGKNISMSPKVIEGVPDASEAKRQFLASKGANTSKYTVQVREVTPGSTPDKYTLAEKAA